MNYIVKILSINLGILTFLLFFAFITAQIYHSIKHRNQVNYYSYDKQLGWVITPKKKIQKFASDKTGRQYKINITTNEHGFRAWGNIDSKKKKILFIGDSFTADPNMSDADSYFGVVAKGLPVEVFATGGGGYGTLQELLLLQKFIKVIHPDFVVLQFHPNDYINNSLALEENFIVRNQKNLRPYFHAGSIIQRQGIASIYRLLYHYSSIFRLLDIHLQQYQYEKYKGYYSREFVGSLMHKKLMNESYEITRNLLEKFVSEVKSVGAKGLIFSCRENKNKWIELSNSVGLKPLPDVAMAVRNAESSGISVRAADGAHWNDLGHQIAGKVLTKALASILLQ
ncbi:MAG: SGNH/GDSL hydrolase family protein [gamma proteobacterium symbiont of Taylorina sp.]|nr:SGNH/GDSL hydrolase family protein [gamma proteobacterium symbiont of Taylorina sp.]